MSFIINLAAHVYSLKTISTFCCCPIIGCIPMNVRLRSFLVIIDKFSHQEVKKVLLMNTSTVPRNNVSVQYQSFIGYGHEGTDSIELYYSTRIKDRKPGRGIDHAHAVYIICAQIADEAIASGLTTVPYYQLGGGTGPVTGTCATTCMPYQHDASKYGLHIVTQLLIHWKRKWVSAGWAHGSGGSRCLWIDTSRGGLGINYSKYYVLILVWVFECCGGTWYSSTYSCMHTDSTLNESTTCEGSIAAFKGRTIHAYHSSEGAGGGHAPVLQILFVFVERWIFCLVVQEILVSDRS